MKKQTGTIKEKAYQYWAAFKWDKNGFATFYQQCRTIPESEWGKVILRKKWWLKAGTTTRHWKWAEEMSWFDRQPHPKPDAGTFRCRLNSGYTKEQGLLMWEEWQQVMYEKIGQRKKSTTPYKATYSAPPEERFDQDLYRIDITYPPEVAKAFRREYLELISEVENELQETEDKIILKWLVDKLDLLKAEVSIFNLYNKQ